VHVITTSLLMTLLMMTSLISAAWMTALLPKALLQKAWPPKALQPEVWLTLAWRIVQPDDHRRGLQFRPAFDGGLVALRRWRTSPAGAGLARQVQARRGRSWPPAPGAALAMRPA